MQRVRGVLRCRLQLLHLRGDLLNPARLLAQARLRQERAAAHGEHGDGG